MSRPPHRRPRQDPQLLIVVAADVPAVLETRIALVRRRWRMTPRQIEVLTLLVQGASNKDIAWRLSCAEVTVEGHVSALLRASTAHSRTQLVARFWTLT